MTKSLSYKRINTLMEVVHEKSVSSKTRYGEMVETILLGYKCSHSALIHNYLKKNKIISEKKAKNSSSTASRVVPG